MKTNTIILSFVLVIVIAGGLLLYVFFKEDAFGCGVLVKNEQPTARFEQQVTALDLTDEAVRRRIPCRRIRGRGHGDGRAKIQLFKFLREKRSPAKIMRG